MTTAIANPNSVVARIVAELEQNQEAKTLLLRTLLTDELLALPAHADRIGEGLDALTGEVAGNGRQIAENSQLIAENSRLIAENSRQIAENGRQIAENSRLIAVLTKRVDALVEQVAALTQKVATMDSTIGNLVGDNLERKVHSNIRSILAQRWSPRFRVRRVLQSVVVDSDTDLVEALHDAADAGLIDESAIVGAFAADIILVGRRRGKSSDIYLVAEVSLTVNNDDIARAYERARTIGAVMGGETIAAAIGGIIAPPQTRLAEELGVQILIAPQLQQ